jgi:hypothetical protein
MLLLGRSRRPARFDFGSSMADIVSSRSTIAYDFNSEGVLSQFAINEPIRCYDPVTLALLGLRIEKSRTNSIRNNTMVGAGAGSPGTVPTNWSISTSAGGLTRTLATETVDGIECLTVTYAGTPDASSTINFLHEPSTQIAGANAQVWTYSFFAQLTAGSWANTTPNILVSERDGAGNFLAGSTVGFTPTGAPLRGQRFSLTRTFNNVGTTVAQSDFRITIAAGLPINFTLRIGLPQFEQGEDMTTPIKTSTVAVVRGTGQALLPLAPFVQHATWVVEGRTPHAFPAVSTAALNMSGPSGASAKCLIYNSAGAITAFVDDDVAGTQANVNLGTVNPNTSFKVAARFMPNDVAGSLNGGAVVKDTSAIIPNDDLTAQFLIGRFTLSTRQFNGPIKAITLYPRALSDAELQAVST